MGGVVRRLGADTSPLTTCRRQELSACCDIAFIGALSDQRLGQCVASVVPGVVSSLVMVGAPIYVIVTIVYALENP